MRNTPLVRSAGMCHHHRQTHNMSTSRSSHPQNRLDNCRNHGQDAASTPADMAIFSADLLGEFLACDAALTRLLGYSPQELLGQNLSTIFFATEQANGENLMASAILAATSTRELRLPSGF